MKIRVMRDQLERIGRVTGLSKEQMLQQGKLNKEEFELFDLACKFVIKGNTHEKIRQRKRNKVC